MDASAFQKLISSCDRIIGYAPMADEPAYSDFLKQAGINAPEDSIPADALQDPFETAREFVHKYKDNAVVLFIPGRQFDMNGTRHGRGHGWYDRFLSKVPRQWFRVGVLNADALSSDILVRKPWDEPMDALLIREKTTWRVMVV